jgi:hypothetical protein
LQSLGRREIGPITARSVIDAVELRAAGLRSAVH